MFLTMHFHTFAFPIEFNIEIPNHRVCVPETLRLWNHWCLMGNSDFC